MLWQYAPMPGQLEMLPSYGEPIDPKAAGTVAGQLLLLGRGVADDLKGRQGEQEAAAYVPPAPEAGFPVWAKIALGVGAAGLVGFVIYKATR